MVPCLNAHSNIGSMLLNKATKENPNRSPQFTPINVSTENSQDRYFTSNIIFDKVSSDLTFDVPENRNVLEKTSTQLQMPQLDRKTIQNFLSRSQHKREEAKRFLTGHFERKNRKVDVSFKEEGAESKSRVSSSIEKIQKIVNGLSEVLKSLPMTRSSTNELLANKYETLSTLSEICESNEKRVSESDQSMHFDPSRGMKHGNELVPFREVLEYVQGQLPQSENTDKRFSSNLVSNTKPPCNESDLTRRLASKNANNIQRTSAKLYESSPQRWLNRPQENPVSNQLISSGNVFRMSDDNKLCPTTISININRRDSVYRKCSTFTPGNCQCHPSVVYNDFGCQTCHHANFDRDHISDDEDTEHILNICQKYLQRKYLTPTTPPGNPNNISQPTARNSCVHQVSLADPMQVSRNKNDQSFPQVRNENKFTETADKKYSNVECQCSDYQRLGENIRNNTPLGNVVDPENYQLCRYNNRSPISNHIHIDMSNCSPNHGYCHNAKSNKTGMNSRLGTDPNNRHKANNRSSFVNETDVPFQSNVECIGDPISLNWKNESFHDSSNEETRCGNCAESYRNSVVNNGLSIKGSQSIRVGNDLHQMISSIYDNVHQAEVRNDVKPSYKTSKYTDNGKIESNSRTSIGTQIKVSKTISQNVSQPFSRQSKDSSGLFQSFHDEPSFVVFGECSDCGESFRKSSKNVSIPIKISKVTSTGTEAYAQQCSGIRKSDRQQRSRASTGNFLPFESEHSWYENQSFEELTDGIGQVEISHTSFANVGTPRIKSNSTFTEAEHQSTGVRKSNNTQLTKVSSNQNDSGAPAQLSDDQWIAKASFGQPKWCSEKEKSEHGNSSFENNAPGNSYKELFGNSFDSIQPKRNISKSTNTNITTNGIQQHGPSNIHQYNNPSISKHSYQSIDRSEHFQPSHNDHTTENRFVNGKTSTNKSTSTFTKTSNITEADCHKGLSQVANVFSRQNWSGPVVQSMVNDYGEFPQNSYLNADTSRVISNSTLTNITKIGIKNYDMASVQPFDNQSIVKYSFSRQKQSSEKEKSKYENPSFGNIEPGNSYRELYGNNFVNIDNPPVFKNSSRHSLDRSEHFHCLEKEKSFIDEITLGNSFVNGKTPRHMSSNKHTYITENGVCELDMENSQQLEYQSIVKAPSQHTITISEKIFPFEIHKSSDGNLPFEERSVSVENGAIVRNTFATMDSPLTVTQSILTNTISVDTTQPSYERLRSSRTQQFPQENDEKLTNFTETTRQSCLKIVTPIRASESIYTNTIDIRITQHEPSKTGIMSEDKRMLNSYSAETENKITAIDRLNPVTASIRQSGGYSGQSKDLSKMNKANSVRLQSNETKGPSFNDEMYVYFVNGINNGDQTPARIYHEYYDSDKHEIIESIIADNSFVEENKPFDKVTPENVCKPLFFNTERKSMPHQRLSTIDDVMNMEHPIKTVERLPTLLISSNSQMHISKSDIMASRGKETTSEFRKLPRRDVKLVLEIPVLVESGEDEYHQRPTGTQTMDVCSCIYSVSESTTSSHTSCTTSDDRSCAVTCHHRFCDC